MGSTGNVLTYEVKEGEEGVLRTFIRNKKGISRKGLSDIKNKGLILCNGKQVTVRHVVEVGDVVTIQYPEEKKSEFLIAEPIPLSIVYEDKDILVINKEAGLCMHPTYGQPSETLANGVIYHWEQQGDNESGFHAVNRLDRDTSGIVLIAKNRFSKQQLTVQQKDKTLRRSYLALCEGIIASEAGTVDAPIGRDESHSTRRMVCNAGQYAVTDFYVVARYSQHTLVKVTPRTGRTHQIRVHMSHIGHPLAGDEMYGGSHNLLVRQALHADEMRFIHPVKEEEFSFELPLPSDIKKVIGQLSQ